MLKTQRNWAKTNQPPLLSHYGASLEWVADSELRLSMLAANINILRRNAPFAYLFANGDSLASWSKPPVDKNVDDQYLSTLEAIKLQRGVWFTYSEWEKKTTAVVIAILTNDILPLISYLNEDNYCLLCLPDARPLQKIDQTVSAAGSNLTAIVDLLSDGGCLISAIDYLSFAIQTLDTRYAQYFPLGPDEESS